MGPSATVLYEGSEAARGIYQQIANRYLRLIRYHRSSSRLVLLRSLSASGEEKRRAPSRNDQARQEGGHWLGCEGIPAPSIHYGFSREPVIWCSLVLGLRLFAESLWDSEKIRSWNEVPVPAFCSRTIILSRLIQGREMLPNFPGFS